VVLDYIYIYILMLIIIKEQYKSISSEFCLGKKSQINNNATVVGLNVKQFLVTLS